MKEFIDIYKNFITRDIIYFFGGSFVIMSFLYISYAPPKENLPVFYYVIGAGLSYIIGYTIQEGFSIIGIVTTASISKPKPFYRWMFERFDKQNWNDIPLSNDEINKLRVPLYDEKEQFFGHYQRTVTLKHIGATCGSCFLVITLFFLVKATGCSPSAKLINIDLIIHYNINFDLCIFIAAFLITVCLICTNRIMCMEQAQLIYNKYKKESLPDP
jgi:hypothetical protein